MSAKGRHTIAVFKHRRTAERALRALVEAGVRQDRISVFMQTRSTPGDLDNGMERALNSGGMTGAELGAIAGLGLFAIPGLGPVLGTGPLAAAMTGAIAGGSAGGVAGALAGAGLSEAGAALAEHYVRGGKAILVIRSDGDDAKLTKIAHSKGSVEVASI